MSNPDFETFLATCTEPQLYFAIEELGGIIWRINHDVGHGRMPESCLKDLPQLNESIRLAVGQSARFGVEEPLRENGAGNDNYWKWYRWWNAWHKGMGDEQWDEVAAAMGAKEDLVGFRPEGDWKK